MKKFLSAKGKLTPEQLRLVPEIESKVLAEHQRLKREELQSKLPPRVSPRGVSKNYTSGLFNESNKGYADIRYHVPNAHHFEPKKFEGTNRGTKKKIPEYY